MSVIDYCRKKWGKIPFIQHLHYRLENTLNKGTFSIIIWLSVLTFLVTIFFGGILMLTGLSPDDAHPNNTIFDAFWQSFLHTIDTGAIQADNNWWYRLIAIMITLVGVFIFSALISVLTTGLDKVFVEIRKGRSQVIETEYTLILGWTNKVFKIVSELIEANANQKHAHIVILAVRDKILMEDELWAKIPDHKTTHVIVRTGYPLDFDDLQIVNPCHAKSIIILAPETPLADSYVIKAILALNHLLDNCQQAHSPHIVAELKDTNNIEAVKFWEQKDADNIEEIKSYARCYVHSQDLLGRITAQTSRQSGYSAILTELLNYGGNEMYFKPIPSHFIGKTFTESLFAINQLSSPNCQKTIAYENVAVFGLQRGTEIVINPLGKNGYRTLERGDKLILLAQDDNDGTLKLIDQPNIDETKIAKTAHQSIEHEKLLILGWNDNAYTLLKELVNYLKNDSEIVIVTEIEPLSNQIKNITNNNGVTIHPPRKADTTKHNELEKLSIPSFDSIIILGYPSKTIQERDAKTLLTLLHLRRILRMQASDKEINIVSEMSDDRNRRLAEISNACDFIISDNIISTMLAQLSETKELKPVFDELFDVSGCEIYLRPVTDYIKIDQTERVNFATIIHSAMLKKEIAIGYRKIREAYDRETHYGIYLNPSKSASIEFIAHDKIIVIASN